MSLPPVFEAFEKRVIPFPEDLLQGRNALPLSCKLYLGLTAAAMLFPRDREGFAGYVAQETVSFISEVEALEVESRAETGIEVEAEMEFLRGTSVGPDLLQKAKAHLKSVFFKVKSVALFTCFSHFQKKLSRNPLSFLFRNMM